MERKIITYLQDTFGTRRKISVSAGLASARVEFDVSVEQNRTLAEFEASAIPQRAIDLDKKIREYAARTGQDPETVFENLQDEAIKKGQIGAAVAMNAAAKKNKEGKK
jgi:hypothetical protein